MKYLVLLAAAALAPLAHAQDVHVVKTLDGYACKSIAASEQQQRDTTWIGVPILIQPVASAQRGTVAAATVIAREPAHIVNGYAEVLQLTGQPGWIEADKIIPYRSRSNPFARCTPAVLSNGRIGFG